MTQVRLCVLIAAAGLAGCSSLSPEQQVVNDAAEALGGATRIASATTMVIEGSGTQYNLGQDLTPDASGETFTVSAYRRAVDLDAGRARTELTRQPDFPYWQGPAAQQQVTGIDGAIGYNVAADGTASRVADAVASDRRTELLYHPVAAIRAAIDPAAVLGNLRTEGGETLIDVTPPAGPTFTLAVDAATGLPSRVSTRADNTNLGDVTVSTSFADYQDSDGLQLPTVLTSRIDDFVTQDIRVSQQAVGGDAGDLAAPEAAATAPAVSGPPPVTVTEEPLAPGLWRLAGASHHSVLVEFSDHLLLIEAPQNDDRTLAVIAKARELVPGKPLTQLVHRHHPFDHSGGVRAAIADGLTVITHEGNVAFINAVATRPHTIAPDALAMRPAPVTVEGVADEREISDGTMTVELYPISSSHSETMLMAYLPRQRLLVEADVYTPGAAVHSFAGELVAALGQRALRIDRIVPLHGPVAPYTQLMNEASAAAR